MSSAVTGVPNSLEARSLNQTGRSGALENRNVVEASNTCSKSKWLSIALLVVGVAVAAVGVTGFFAYQGMLPAALAKLNVLGAIGQIGSIAMMAGGGFLALTNVILLIRNKNTEKSRDQTQQELRSRERRYQDAPPSRPVPPAPKSEGNTRVQTGTPRTVTRENPLKSDSNITYIGSSEQPLDLQGIRAQLGELSSDVKVDTLVIYGRNVQLKEDPGIVQLNPKKIILVGAQLVEGQLDNILASKKEWFSLPSKINGTLIQPVEIGSVEDAIAIKRPSRGGTFNRARFHMVYYVRTE